VLIEATTVNGPAKNLLNFCRLAQSSYLQDARLPRVEVSIVTFHRLGEGAEENGQRRQQMNDPPNSFVAVAREEELTFRSSTNAFASTHRQSRRCVALWQSDHPTSFKRT